MATGTVDYYSLLGVEPDASGDEIQQAFRSRAKQLHPDAGASPVAAEEFKELSVAYRVLSDGERRRSYDSTLIRVDPAPAPAVVREREGVATTRAPWSRRKAMTSLLAGLAFVVLGFGAAFVTWHLHDVDATTRAHYTPVTATRLNDGHNHIVFVTRDGVHVVTTEPEQHGEGNGLGSTVKVRYDPADPKHVVVDASTFGRDITLAIVALKFLVGGSVFAILGARRLRRATTAR